MSESVESAPQASSRMTQSGEVSHPMYCANHPGVSTYLRCNKCGKPICTKCAVHMSVGYRCRECVRGQQEVFYADFRLRHYVIAAGVSLPLSLIAGRYIPILGWLYVLILSPIAGTAIANVTRWAIKRRRGRYVWLVVCGCIILGALPYVTLALTMLIAGARNGIAGIAVVDLLQDGLYVALAAGAAYAQLRPDKRIV